MKRLFCIAVLAALSISAQDFKLGSKVDDFSVKDVKGKTVPLSSVKGDVTVVAFIATQCPVSNAYNERMNALYNDYAPKGVKFVFINSNNTEPAAEVEQHASKHGFPFAVYKDDGNVVADRFGAQVTPEIFVLDKGSVIRYHGPIDDSQAPQRIKNNRLRSALDSMLAGKDVETAQAKAFGCTIKRKKSS